MLSIHEATRHFGGLTAVSKVTFDVAEGEIMGVIGPNGAGKTTFFNLVSGAIPLSSGSITFDGRSIGGLPPHRVAHLGIGRTFQIVRPFGELSVLDNVLAGMGAVPCRSLPGALRLCKRQKHLDKARAILASTRLLAVENEVARNLPLGLLRRLEIARALALQPKLLLLDESFSGLSHKETESLSELVLELRTGGMTVLLIEHNMHITMNLCDRLVVLDRGHKIAEGTPDAIRLNEAVVSAYLGTED
ncbi:ABC transporter ATP-binding protein [Bradyrhizobium sp. NP1]|uniref:ABC transporter ATP-binding protein n=1 Tax=Bradyrhizobium sp. NP1 TaxID=3049772 RepID=UPI0025A53001|nr:ABC transporter ATP-binding protein [Bradyrhizobium sp. NP1]WJR76840.1 ABC transporter ATP-binding protein [Bradyrhizobium sp. NP1]